MLGFFAIGGEPIGSGQALTAPPPGEGLPPTPAPAFFETTLMREVVLFRTVGMSDSINLIGNLL